MKKKLLPLALLVALPCAAADIFVSAGAGDIAGIKLAIEQGVDVNKKNEAGQTPQEFARAKGQTQAAAFLDSLVLIKYGDGGSYTGQTKDGLPHGWGIYTGARGGMYSGSFAKGKAHGYGVWKDAAGRLKGGEFLDNGGRVVPLRARDLFGADAEGEGPLFRAVKSGSLIKAELLVSRGEDANAASRKKQTALHFASFEGRVDMMKLLLTAGAAVDAVDEDGMRPLHFAAFGGKAAAAELLLMHGAVVSAKNCNGSTPLHFAAYADSVETAAALVRFGASISARDNYGKTPAEHAAALKNKSAENFLKQMGIGKD